MLIVGLTGGIGSGKSAVTEEFKKLGSPIVDADIVSREVVEPGSAALQTIHTRFGDDVLLPDGHLNRSRLRDIIFTDSANKAWLEQLLHPLIQTNIKDQLSSLTGDYGILVSPLLFETRQDKLTHYNIVVDIPEELQKSRTRQRDKVSEEQIREIILSQMPRKERLARADTVIDNSGDLEGLHKQVITLHQQLLQRAQEY